MGAKTPGMRKPGSVPRFGLSSLLFLLAWAAPVAPAETFEAALGRFKMTETSLSKAMAALAELNSRKLPLDLSGRTVEGDIANLKKQAEARGILKKQRLSLREFVLTYKAVSQIRKASKAEEEWQRLLQNPDASAPQKLEATQKLGQVWKDTLCTPEQIELLRHHLPELDKLMAASE